MLVTTVMFGVVDRKLSLNSSASVT
ncbi:MAG: hypothetical protein ACD_31C00105G0001, partial [uncultured bacterium]